MRVWLPEHLKSWPMTVGQGGSCSTDAAIPSHPNSAPQGRKNNSPSQKEPPKPPKPPADLHLGGQKKYSTFQNEPSKPSKPSKPPACFSMWWRQLLTKLPCFCGTGRRAATARRMRFPMKHGRCGAEPCGTATRQLWVSLPATHRPDRIAPPF